MGVAMHAHPQDARVAQNCWRAPFTRRRFLGVAAACALAAGAGRVTGAQADEKTEGSAAPNWPYSSVKDLLPASEPDPRDDFYAAVNYAWLSESELPAGISRLLGFAECDAAVSERLTAVLRNPAADSDGEQKAARLFAQALDREARDAAGLGTYYAADLRDILAVSTLDDVTALLSTNERVVRATQLVSLSVAPDYQDSGVNACYIGPTYLALSDSSGYVDPTESLLVEIAALETYASTLLAHFGVPAEEARQMAADYTAFGTALVAGAYAAGDKDDDEVLLTSGRHTRTEYAQAAGVFPLLGMLDACGLGRLGDPAAGADASRLILEHGDWFDALVALYTPQNTGLIRAYLAVGLLFALEPYCDSACAAAASAYENEVFGSSGSQTWEERAYDCVDQLVGDLLGSIYAQHFFSLSAKHDVEGIVDELLAAFERRLATAGWLGETTRATAIEKLRAIGVRVGYPDAHWPWEQVALDEASFIDNVAVASQATAGFAGARAGMPVDTALWTDGICAHTVNAYLDIPSNTVVLPAGILQGVFYDPAAPRAANLGGIGTIIGHEITHAFDTTGSHYDKDGNLRDWWTDEDFATFKERAAAVSDYYEGIAVIDGLHLHDDLTVGENIADLGGVAAALDVLEQDADPDYDAFFRAWAANWRSLIAWDYALYFLEFDSHAPEYLRTNVVVQQFQQFYDTYGVVEGDGMYLAPEQRLGVW